MWIHGGLRKVYFLILHFPLLCTLVPSLFKGHWIRLMIFLTFFSRTLNNFYFSILFQETLFFNHILIPVKRVTNLFSVSLFTCSLLLRNPPPRLHQHTQRNMETSSSEWSITQSSFSGQRKYVCQEGSLKVRKKKKRQAFPNQLSVYHPSAVPLESLLCTQARCCGAGEPPGGGLMGKPGQYLTSWVTEMFMVNMIQWAGGTEYFPPSII